MYDKMCAMYSYRRSTRRWRLVMFHGTLNVRAINAFVVYHNNMNPEMTRREFLKKLFQEL